MSWWELRRRISPVFAPYFYCFTFRRKCRNNKSFSKYSSVGIHIIWKFLHIKHLKVQFILMVFAEYCWTRWELHEQSSATGPSEIWHTQTRYVVLIFKVSITLIVILCFRFVQNKKKKSPFMEFYRRMGWWLRTPMFVMACSHCKGTGLGQLQGAGVGLLGSKLFYRNGHTGPRQGKEPGSIVSYCAGPVPCHDPGPVHVQYE